MPGNILRAARAATVQSLDAVSLATLVSVSTIKRAEAASSAVITAANADRLISFYRSRGVEIFNEARGSYGLRARPTSVG